MRGRDQISGLEGGGVEKIKRMFKKGDINGNEL